MSFMSIAPRPHTQSSAISPEKGSCASPARGRDHVEVTVDEEGGSFAVPALDAGDDAGALGVRFQDYGVEAYLGQESGDVFGGLALAGTGVVAGIGGVDPDQVAADGHDLVLRGLAGSRVLGSLVSLSLDYGRIRTSRPLGVPAGWRAQAVRAGSGADWCPAHSLDAVRFAKVSQPMRTPHRASGWRNRQTR
jgi:hypothetical protein